MTEITKGKSPFYPGQPVPVELFAGRKKQLDRIMTRGVGQVILGKPVALFIEGEYGIGKSSIAGFVQFLAEKKGLHGIYAPLGGAKDLSDVAKAVLEATLRSGALDPNKTEKIRNWLARYIGKQNLYGFTVNAEALKQDAPTLSSAFGLLQFLTEVKNRLLDTGIKGIFLILDEINGITANPDFAHFVKAIVDTNAMSTIPLPLLFMLCGVEARRHEMIQKHEPINRIFDVIEIEAMNEEEAEDFFKRAFDSVHISIEQAAIKKLVTYSAGFPKMMHLVGDAAYWTDQDNHISEQDAMAAIVIAADEVGKKYVDQQVYKAIRSSDYHSILMKIAHMGPDQMSFVKSEVEPGLTSTEKGKLDNFLQKMKTLNVIRSGDKRGEYIFNMRMVRLYIWLQSLEKSKSDPA